MTDALKAAFWAFSGTFVVWAMIAFMAIFLVVVPHVALGVSLVYRLARSDPLITAVLFFGACYYTARLLS